MRVKATGVLLLVLLTACFWSTGVLAGLVGNAFLLNGLAQAPPVQTKEVSVPPIPKDKQDGLAAILPQWSELRPYLVRDLEAEEDFEKRYLAEGQKFAIVDAKVAIYTASNGDITSVFAYALSYDNEEHAEAAFATIVPPKYLASIQCLYAQAEAGTLLSTYGLGDPATAVKCSFRDSATYYYEWRTGTYVLGIIVDGSMENEAEIYNLALKMQERTGNLPERRFPYENEQLAFALAR